MTTKKYFNINHGIYYYPYYNKPNKLFPMAEI